MERSFRIRCEDPDQFRYWLEGQVQDADLRTFPIKGGHFSLEWPRVENEEPLRVVMDGVYTYERPERAEGRMDSHGVSNVITFELRGASPPWMELTAKFNAEMPAARTYFEHLLEALERDWEVKSGRKVADG